MRPHRAARPQGCNPAGRHRGSLWTMTFDLERYSYIGTTPAGAPFGITQEDRRRHLHIVGHNSWAPRLHHSPLNTARPLWDAPGQPLLGTPRLLMDEGSRARITRQVKDPVVRSFWLQKYPSYDRRFLSEANSPVLNK